MELDPNVKNERIRAMTSEELMRLSAEKAIHEISEESIEFLFRPLDGMELLLRLDFKGTKQKIHDWIADNSPNAMPHRFRPPYTSRLLGMIKREEFYRKMAALRAAPSADSGDSVQRRRDDIFREMCG